MEKKKEYQVIYKFGDVMDTIEADNEGEAKNIADEKLNSLEGYPKEDTKCYEIEVEEVEENQEPTTQQIKDFIKLKDVDIVGCSVEEIQKEFNITDQQAIKLLTPLLEEGYIYEPRPSILKIL